MAASSVAEVEIAPQDPASAGLSSLAVDIFAPRVALRRPDAGQAQVWTSPPMPMCSQWPYDSSTTSKAGIKPWEYHGLGHQDASKREMNSKIFPFLKEENDDEPLDCLYTLFWTKIWSRMIDEIRWNRNDPSFMEVIEWWLNKSSTVIIDILCMRILNSCLVVITPRKWDVGG